MKALIRQYFEDNRAQEITPEQRSVLLEKIKVNHPAPGYDAQFRCSKLIKGVKGNIAKAEAKVSRNALPKVPFLSLVAVKAIVAGILTAEFIEDLTNFRELVYVGETGQLHITLDAFRWFTERNINRDPVLRWVMEQPATKRTSQTSGRSVGHHITKGEAEAHGCMAVTVYEAESVANACQVERALQELFPNEVGRPLFRDVCASSGVGDRAPRRAYTFLTKVFPVASSLEFDAEDNLIAFKVLDINGVEKKWMVVR